MIFTRFDTCEELGKPVELPNGWLKVDAYISRVGTQIYDRNGKEYVEYRPPEEVFHADTLESFDAVPLTNDHPRVALDAHNTSAYQVGSVRSPRQDGARTRATILVTDAKAIAALRSGKAQISCGYTAELDEVPGTAPDGSRYDARQKNIRGNHVAIVDEGRAGPECRVRMDSAGRVQAPGAGAILDGVDKVAVPSQQVQPTLSESEALNMDELKRAIEALTAANARADAAEKALVALQASADKTQARADSLEAEVKALPAKIQAQVAARTALESKAKAALPGVITDGKTDAEIKRQVIESRGTVKCDGRSEAYLDAAFDLTCDLEAREDSAPIADVVDAADENDAVSKAQKAFADRMSSHFNKPSKV